MANWAALQEQLTGKRVVKRAKHSIHFDKGNGEIVANFSGARCHYEDKGVWKPIDTTLLLGADGFYGCPHSPVKVHKDGRVKVDKSDYSQFTKLPGSPVGKVDGDRIVREFPGGYQELFVTEDGFREVITVVKRTFPIEKFLAKQSGTLPSAYKTSPQTAVDANGDVFEITSDTKAFGDWLDGAVYPVTIDPDFSTTSSGGDNFIRSGVPNNYGTADSIQLVPDARKGLLRFPLDSISSSATCSAATLQLSVTQGSGITLSLYKIMDANGNWAETTCNWDYKVIATSTAWAGSAGLSTAGTDFVNTNLVSSSFSSPNYTLTFNASGLAVLQDWFGDASNNGLLLIGSSTTYYIASKEYATESYRPKLTVTYTTGSTGVPKHFLHYARLRSN